MYNIDKIVSFNTLTSTTMAHYLKILKQFAFHVVHFYGTNSQVNVHKNEVLYILFKDPLPFNIDMNYELAGKCG